MRSLEAVAGRLREQLEATNASRETALKECREIIRLSSRTIRAALSTVTRVADVDTESITVMATRTAAPSLLSTHG